MLSKEGADGKIQIIGGAERSFSRSDRLCYDIENNRWEPQRLGIAKTEARWHNILLSGYDGAKYGQLYLQK